MASTLLEQVSVTEVSPDTFESTVNPDRMGNAKEIAYGGCTIAVAIQAACRTVADGYFLYTAMGNYLGPALIDRKLHCTVKRLRDTRTFATRYVELSQEQTDGSKRACMVILADFQVKEKASMLIYSAPPMKAYSPPEKCSTVQEGGEKAIKQGLVPPKVVKLHEIMFGLMLRFFETRPTPEGVSSQNLSGIANVQTSQAHLPLTERTSADWFRTNHPLGGWRDQYAGCGFVMDGFLSFLPLAHSNKSLLDVAACSSLDFALRFFTSDLDLTKWHMRELKTITGNDGRTYTESRLWDEKGRMVANMTQQSILRPKPGDKANL